MSDPAAVPVGNTFERIKRTNSADAEFWSARELARVCVNSGRPVTDHLVDITEMVSIGSKTPTRQTARSTVGRSALLIRVHLRSFAVEKHRIRPAATFSPIRCGEGDAKSA